MPMLTLPIEGYEVGFLRRLLGAERQMTLSLTRFTMQRPEAELDIVGEASYQQTLVGLARELGWDGPVQRSHTAIASTMSRTVR
jgi:hypothetical protein